MASSHGFDVMTYNLRHPPHPERGANAQSRVESHTDSTSYRSQGDGWAICVNEMMFRWWRGIEARDWYRRPLGVYIWLRNRTVLSSCRQEFSSIPAMHSAAHRTEVQALSSHLDVVI